MSLGKGLLNLLQPHDGGLLQITARIILRLNGIMKCGFSFAQQQLSLLV